MKKQVTYIIAIISLLLFPIRKGYNCREVRLRDLAKAYYREEKV